MESKAGFFFVAHLYAAILGGFSGTFVNEDLEDLIDKVLNMFFVQNLGFV